MRCPVCWQDAPLTKTGQFALHRVMGADSYSMCPMSGEPVPVSVSDTKEFAC